MLRQGTYYIIAPTYKQAKSIYWREICKLYRGDFMTFNEQELSITFDHLSGMEIETTSGKIVVNHDPDLPPTRIELKGADNPDSLRGTGICGAVMDEYAFMPDGKYLYDTIVRPPLLTATVGLYLFLPLMVYRTTSTTLSKTHRKIPNATSSLTLPLSTTLTLLRRSSKKPSVSTKRKASSTSSIRSG
jgi:hypothetical protein